MPLTRDNLTARTARATGIAEAQLRSFADFTEQQTRAYLAQGFKLDAALARAADDTIEIARAVGAV